MIFFAGAFGAAGAFALVRACFCSIFFALTGGGGLKVELFDGGAGFFGRAFVTDDGGLLMSGVALRVVEFAGRSAAIGSLESFSGSSKSSSFSPTEGSSVSSNDESSSLAVFLGNRRREGKAVEEIGTKLASATMNRKEAP